MSIRRKPLAVIIAAVLVIALLILWAVKHYETNSRKYPQLVETYEMGETVELEEDFFIDANENPKGYSVKVNSARLVEYKSYLEESGGVFDAANFTPVFPAPKYAYLLNVTLKNTDNTEGYIAAIKYSLYNKSLQIPVDLELWDLSGGTPGFKLLENSEVDVTIPFTANISDCGINNPLMEKMMEQEDFFFCVSEFPVRKLIRIHM